MINHVLVNKRQIKKEALSDDELFDDDEQFNEPTTFHGYEINMLKKWIKVTLTNVDIQKSKFGYHIKNLSDEQKQLISDEFINIHPKLKLEKNELFLRSHPNMVIIDSNGKQVKDIVDSGLASLVQIQLQGYKMKDGKILPIWRLNEILYV